MIRMFTAMLLLSVSADLSFCQEVDRPTAIAPGTLLFREESRLLLHCYDAPQGGLLVEWADSESPANRMTKADDPQVQGVIERGDLIVRIDGKTISSLADYFRIMRSVGPTITITIRDVNTGRQIDWLVKPVKVSVPIGPDTQVQVSNSKLHVIYAALTDDSSIGNFIKLNVPEFQRLIETQIRQDRRGSFVTLTGANCNASSIIAAVDALSVAPQDSIFVMYEGHGAYDPAISGGDPAQGHFFSLPNGDLPRKDLLHHVLAKRPRFTLLMSDCCNSASKVSLRTYQAVETKLHAHTGWRALEELAFCYRGVLDVTACSRDELSWFSSDIGGWFSHTMIYSLSNMTTEPSRKWDPIWTRISKKTDELFAQKKQQFGATNQQLNNQARQVPMAFAFDVTRDEPSDTPTAMITTEIMQSKLVNP